MMALSKNLNSLANHPVCCTLGKIAGVIPYGSHNK